MHKQIQRSLLQFLDVGKDGFLPREYRADIGPRKALSNSPRDVVYVRGAASSFNVSTVLHCIFMLPTYASYPDC
jgi:hypothetical protein